MVTEWVNYKRRLYFITLGYTVKIITIIRIGVLGVNLHLFKPIPVFLIPL